jgi:hypothetical protein
MKSLYISVLAVLLASISAPVAFCQKTDANINGHVVDAHTNFLIENFYTLLNDVFTIEKRTPDFFDVGMKLSYHFHLSKATELEVNGGVKNVLNSFQRDLDFGQTKDAAYVYGPSFPRMVFWGIKMSI